MACLFLLDKKEIIEIENDAFYIQITTISYTMKGIKYIFVLN